MIFVKIAWETVAVAAGFVAILGYIIFYRLQKLKEEREPDVRKMNDLLFLIGKYMEELEKIRASEKDEKNRKIQTELPENTVRALNGAQKIVVVCHYKNGKIDPEEEEGDCAVMIYRQGGSYYPLYTAKRLEYNARFARKLSRILSLPIEMV